MYKIKQLPLEEIKKIAAGEVVERPSNIVKELIENSIDANSSQITLFIQDGGKKLIKLVDNGIGMSGEDAKESIKHHATSKISKVEDLQSIATFGFRGEALSSISSVSSIILTTKLHDQDCANTLSIDQGAITQETLSAGNNGTTITITNLFDNIPARKKFLKSTQTEYRSISQLFNAYCLSNWSISFKMYSEGKLIFNCPQTDSLEKRLEQLFDTDLTSNILSLEKINDSKNKFKLEGAITKPVYTRYDRSYIYTFVNRRLVKNYKLSQALIRGYQAVLPKGKFPCGFLFITISPELIDVNIHPRKEEVQFVHPAIIEREVSKAIQKTLESHHTNLIQPARQNKWFDNESNTYLSNFNRSLEFDKNRPGIAYTDDNLLTEADTKNHFSDSSFYKIIDENFDAINPITEDRDKITVSEFKLDDLQLSQDSKMKEESLSISYADKIAYSVGNITKNEIRSSQETEVQLALKFQHEKTETNSATEHRIIGQSMLTYIILETSQGLVFVDQHAAHERIIYQDLKNNFCSSQKTIALFNQPIKLAKEDIKALILNQTLLSNFGLDIEQIGQSSIRVNQLPLILKQDNISEILKQMASLINENDSNDKEAFDKLISEKIHAKMSCVAAVKAGDKLTQISMESIVNRLYSIENRLTCPHGRPTIWPLNKLDLEKKFKRNYR